MEAFSESILLSDAIVIQYARIHDIGPCWSKFWERKYKVNVDILYRYQLRLQMRFQFLIQQGGRFMTCGAMFIMYHCWRKNKNSAVA